MELEKLQQKLPQLKDWIERTLGAHRAEARPAASYHFKRLPQFFTPIFLETAFVVIVPRPPIPPLTELGLPELQSFEKTDHASVAYRNTYFITEAGSTDESLHFHELVHILQWQYLGVDTFLTTYGTGIAEHGYRNSPLEVMAYDLQAQFDQGVQTLDLRSIVRNQVAKLKKP